jgi:dTMP kinase
MFITLEGIEGSGKSIQARRLWQRLVDAGRAAHLTREPGGTPLADAIRAILMHPDPARAALEQARLAPALPTGEPAEAVLPLTELLLLAAARTQLTERIREWLAGGAIVVCDRYADSTRAYQGYGRGLPDDWIATLERLATGGLRPDVTLLLDLPVAEGQRRKQAAHAAGGEWNRLDGEAPEFHERVRAGYLVLAAAEPARWVVLDAAQGPDALAEAVWAAVRERLSAS